MKSIIVPLDVDAMQRLEYDDCKHGDLIEMLLNEDEYKKLWSTGVFDVINNELDTNIDDYEDDSIIGVNALYLVQGIILARKDIISDSEVLDKLLSQVNLAIKMETGLFLFF